MGLLTCYGAYYLLFCAALAPASARARTAPAARSIIHNDLSYMSIYMSI